METEISKKRTRRMRTKAERREIVEEMLVGGASVSRMARSHDVNANQVFNWRRRYRAARLETESSSPSLLPVKITGSVERPQRVSDALNRSSRDRVVCIPAAAPASSGSCVHVHD